MVSHSNALDPIITGRIVPINSNSDATFSANVTFTEFSSVVLCFTPFISSMMDNMIKIKDKSLAVSAFHWQFRVVCASAF